MSEFPYFSGLKAQHIPAWGNALRYGMGNALRYGMRIPPLIPPSGGRLATARRDATKANGKTPNCPKGKSLPPEEGNEGGFFGTSRRDVPTPQRQNSPFEGGQGGCLVNHKNQNNQTKTCTERSECITVQTNINK